MLANPIAGWTSERTWRPTNGILASAIAKALPLVVNFKFSDFENQSLEPSQRNEEKAQGKSPDIPLH